MMIGIGLGLTQLSGGGSPDAAISALFANGEQGAWFDPSDLSTLFQDRAGTIPVTAPGQLVGLQRDKSPWGHHRAAINDAARGTYQTDGKLHWIVCDGINTGYVTPTVTPGTDKAQVFAAVRKLSDAARAMVIETGIAQSGGNIRFEAPPSTPGLYAFVAGGTTPASLATSVAAPDTSVFAGLCDIGGDSAVLRRNGVQVNFSSGDQGTGNFDAHPLYFYRRGGTTLPFNGQSYGEVIRFGPPLTAAQIAQTERWLASKCGVTL